MSMRFVIPLATSLALVMGVGCGEEPTPEASTEEQTRRASGELRRPLNMDDAIAAGFTKQTEQLYKRIAAEDGWEGTFQGARVQVYIFPEIVRGYVPTSFFSDAVEEETKWKAHRIVRNVGILCSSESACDELEAKLRVAGGGSAEAETRSAVRPGQTPPGESRVAESERPVTGPDSETERPPARVEESETAEAASEPSDQTTPMNTEPQPEARLPVGDPLGYSVAIASFTALEDAIEKQRELSRPEMAPLFVAPVAVGGRIYYRLLAGTLGTREEARDLQRTLVAEGVKSEATAWDIRPARLAFHMGTYGESAEAESRVEALLAQRVPAYTIRGPNGLYVYAGGYESEDAAETLAETIRGAGLEAELVERRGAGS